MALISGQVQSYSAVNLEGPLYNTTPEDTPLTTALGNLFGGEGVNSKIFRWQEYDLRDAGDNAQLEGIDAPSATGRKRANVYNVLQIIHETVDVSYTQQNQFRGIEGNGGSGTNTDATGQGNPVTDEYGWQITQRMKEIARDVEWSIINQTFVDDTDINTERKTKGLLEAISTNAFDQGGTSDTATIEADDEIVTAAAHGLSDGDKIQFTALSGGTGLSLLKTYYVVNSTTGNFQVALNAGGPAVNVTADASSATFEPVGNVTTDVVLDVMQSVWDNGGIREQETATLIANSGVKRNLTSAFLDAGSSGTGFRQDNRNVGGVNLMTFDTDFGRVNVMLNRYMPTDTLLIASLDELRLKWMNDPRGFLFAEDLGKNGSKYETQIYGEFGLMFGNEKAHGKIAGLANA